jgi:hypothetical protein
VGAVPYHQAVSSSGRPNRSRAACPLMPRTTPMAAQE